jgi:hypothetical protein
MPQRRPHLGIGLALISGLGVGWWLGAARAPSLRAGGADRWNDRVLTTGPVIVERNRDGQVVNTRDGLYILNYSQGLLLAALPDYAQTSAGAKVLSDFAERDLVRDFGLAPHAPAHFLMTTMSLGLVANGWTPLIVVETESGQIAAYRVDAQTTATGSRPTLQLVERRRDPRLARAVANAGGPPATR